MASQCQMRKFAIRHRGAPLHRRFPVAQAQLTPSALAQVCLSPTTSHRVNISCRVADEALSVARLTAVHCTNAAHPLGLRVDVLAGKMLGGQQADYCNGAIQRAAVQTVSLERARRIASSKVMGLG